MLCRDDRCDREDVHPAHEVFEGCQDEAKRASGRQPDEALLEILATKVTRAVPKSSAMLYNDTINDYGSVNKRTFYRYLEQLIERGLILRVDLGQRLYAYLHPSSTLADDTDLLLEQIRDTF